MVFAAKQLQEKCQQQNVDLYSTYVDLTKAFDTVSREGLWRIMAKYGCPPKFITIVHLLHDGMMARFQNDGNSSEPFLVSNGVKQGCVLAPTLFSLMFSAMLTDAFADTDIGIGIRHRMDGSVFNLRKLKAKTKVKTDTINDFLFADDCALNFISADDMQQNVDKFAEACTNFGLTISIKKTEVMHQPAPGKTYIEPSITINGQCLKAVDKFTYLGSTLSRNVVIDDEADARLAKANSAFGRQQKCMEPAGHHSRDQNQGIPCRCVDHAPVRLRNLDSLPTPCRKTQTLPHHTPQEATWDKMARQNP